MVDNSEQSGDLIFSDEHFGRGIGAGFRKAGVQLRRQVNGALTTYETDGTLRDIYASYLDYPLTF